MGRDAWNNNEIENQMKTVSTLKESDLLDGSWATISLNVFNTLEGIKSLWDDVVGICN